MEARIDFKKVMHDVRKVYEAMLGVEGALNAGPLPTKLLDLVRMRASQINGCAYCLDMHSKELRAHGETEQRIYCLNGWEECPFYSDKERAALAWTEAVTLVTEGHVPDEVYEKVRKQFTDIELVYLTAAIGAINLWNRLNVGLRTVAGGYQPNQSQKSSG